MSCTNISLADLQYTIEEKELYVKERELMSQDEWLEQARKSLFEADERIDKSISSSEEGSVVESDEEFQADEEESSPEKSNSVLTVLSKVDEYRSECLKYMIAPCSMMNSVGEITQLNLEVL